MSEPTHRIIIRRELSKVFSCSCFQSIFDFHYFFFCSNLRCKNISLTVQRILKDQCRRDGLPWLFELSLLITDDLGISKLNWQYRQKKEATDVLSFPQISFPQGTGTSEYKKNPEQFAKQWIPLYDMGIQEHYLLGDVVISYQTCMRQAKQQSKDTKLSKQDIAREFFSLLAHGILHLFGYDHEVNDRSAKLMFQLQQELLMI